MYTHPLPSLRRGEKERNQYIDLKRECGTGGGGVRSEREINILKERKNVEQVVGEGGGEERERERQRDVCITMLGSRSQKISNFSSTTLVFL